MSMTGLAEVADQIQKFWSPIFVPELRQSNPLIELVSKQYEGAIQKGGDTVRVSQIVKVPATRKTIGAAGYNSFDSNTLQTRYVDVKADQIITAAVEISTLAELQSQIGAQQSTIREALMAGVRENINTFLYGKVAPAAAHEVIASDINKATLIDLRTLASKAKLPTGNRFGLISPEYWATLLNDNTLTSADYVDDKPVVGGQAGLNRMGFQMFEDDSRDGKTALFFNPDFLHFVMQMQPEFKVSDLHANKQHGYLLSVSLVCGAAQGIEGDKKHLTVNPA